jgi:H+/Cl- antiporter ClcA
MKALYSLIGFLTTCAGATLLYAASKNQRLVSKRPRSLPMLVAGGFCLAGGLAFWIAEWGGSVGGLLAFGVWATVSAVLPFVFARRKL